MNAKLKSKWIKALRSGKYAQITGHLQRPEGYCCLGVLCVVAGLPIKDNVVIGRENESYEPIRELGIDGSIMDECWARNDGIGTRKQSFAKIANYIEKEL